MQDKNATLREQCSKLEQRLVAFETSTNNFEQYSTRNNIVISGIPDSVDVNHLEESVTEILSDTDVKVTSNDLLTLVTELVRKIIELIAQKK